MSFRYEDYAEFEGTRSTITGTAVYTYDMGYSYGDDYTGWEVDVELLRVECDSLHLTRSQIEEVVGKHGLKAKEEEIAESLIVEMEDAA